MENKLEETRFSDSTVNPVPNIWKLFIYKRLKWNIELLHQDTWETPPFGIHSPNIHTSLAEVNRRKLIDSGAIHLIGNFPLEATAKEREGRLLALLLSSNTDFVLLDTEKSSPLPKYSDWLSSFKF